MGNRAIVLSGGGAKGSWGVGVIKGLFEQGRIYNTAIGTSTGSLMAPFVLAGAIEQLEEGYTNVGQDDIFSKNPFKTDGSIKGFQAAMRVIRGKRTLGESEKLREKIAELITEELFSAIRDQNKLFGATVVNFNRGRSEVKTNINYSNDQMRDWTWASANNPLFMSSFDFEEDGDTHTYADGGVTSFANVEYILQNRPAGLTDIDVIFHNTREVIEEGYQNEGGLLKRLFRVMDIFKGEIFKNDLLIAKLNTQNFPHKVRFSTDQLTSDINLTIYYMTDQDIVAITGESRNTLLFNKQRMQVGVMRGHHAISNGTIDKDECTIFCEGGRIRLNVSNPPP